MKISFHAMFPFFVASFICRANTRVIIYTTVTSNGATYIYQVVNPTSNVTPPIHIFISHMYLGEVTGEERSRESFWKLTIIVAY